MSLQEQFLRTLVAKGVAHCLTGRSRELKMLLALARLPIPNPALTAFLKRLERDLADGTGLARILLHVGRRANARSKQKLIENLFFNWILEGGRIRTAIRTTGAWPPFFIVISPTMRCNLKCTGCYAGMYCKDGELTETELDDLLCQCESIGAYFVVLSGGEPFLMKDTLCRLFEKHPAIFFLVFTNGLLLDEATVEHLATLGTVAPAISVEGYQDETDARRGSGVHAKVLGAMQRLRERGVLFGISVTYTRENVGVVTTDEFVRFYGGLGAVFGWYFMFMPVGKDPRLDLVPTPEQRVSCGRCVRALRERHAMFLADFWNDGPAIGGCMAAGRRYLHVLNSGRIEPCVYAHFGVDNIRQTTLLDAANSAFFRAIRREFPYSPSGNLKRPCMIIDNPSVLRRVVREHVAQAGHPHAEDVVLDPTVEAWIDEYARRLEQLTEADWQQIIADPGSRWYREGDEYRNLFQVHAGDRPCEPAPASFSHSQSGSGLKPL